MPTPIMTSIMHQCVAAECALEMAQLLDAKRERIKQIIEQEQAHRVQVATLSQMQLQAMKRVEEKSCRDLVLCWWSTRHF